MKLARTLDIGLDIDGVLYPFQTVYTRFAEKYLGLPVGSLNDESLSWNWYKNQWGWTTDKFLEVFEAGVCCGTIFSKGEALPGAVNAANVLSRLGHRIHYVTDRQVGVTSTEAEFITRTWLCSQGFPVDSITITPDKSSVHTDIFLDDAPHNIEALVSAKHSCPVIWETTWNRVFTKVSTVPTVNSWNQFINLVKTESYR